MNVRTRNSTLVLFVTTIVTACYFSIAMESPAPPVASEALPTPRPTGVEISLAGTSPTKEEAVELNVTRTPSGLDGKFRVFVNSRREDDEPEASETISVDLPEERTYTISVTFLPDDQTYRPSNSNTVEVTIDRTGPILQRVEVVDVPGTGTTLIATFADDDLMKSPARDQFQVIRQNNEGKFSDDGQITYQVEPEVIGRTVRLRLSSLPAGLYRLVVKGTKAASPENGSRAAVAPFRDMLGNPAHGGDDRHWEFSVLADRKFGEHVEFPPFAPPKRQVPPREGFNPDDFVETRVARLYYYRDAHRVAEIINRNVRSFNQVAVTQAERRAEAARTTFEDKVDLRRKSEREAVIAAQSARNAEAKLASAREALKVVADIDVSLTENRNRRDELIAERDSPATGEQAKNSLQSQIDRIDAEIRTLQATKDSLGDTATLRATVESMEQSVANLRQTEIVKQESVHEAQAAENRAAATKFREEVAAANADPDTYVAGDIYSVDPVTQVSISVIGEGLIQLRGPVKGINKIRTMINQIDSPVGQIKIGIFTIQVNGERGDRMEHVVGAAEGHLDLARALVNQSLELLRRSIQTEAALIAEQCEVGGHYQVDRDRRYLYGFFGRDFIDELYAMNSEFLFSENTLLSLHSMDTVSLNRALFILALAKNDVRERVIARFLEAAKTDLAEAEFDLRRSSELKPHRTQKYFPPWNQTRLPVWNRTHQEEVIYEAVHRNAMQRYHFRNVRSFFDVGFSHPDTINPMQREFLRLAQIFKARLVAEMELRQRVIERGLIEDRSNDEELRRELLEPVHREALELERDAYRRLVRSAKDNANTADMIQSQLDEIMNLSGPLQLIGVQVEEFIESAARVSPQIMTNEDRRAFAESLNNVQRNAQKAVERLKVSNVLARDAQDVAKSVQTQLMEWNKRYEKLTEPTSREVTDLRMRMVDIAEDIGKIGRTLKQQQKEWTDIKERFRDYRTVAESGDIQWSEVRHAYDTLRDLLEEQHEQPSVRDEILRLLEESYEAVYSAVLADQRIAQARAISKRTRGELDHRKLLNYLIDQQEDKFIELVEGTRSHIAIIDNYLKRLSIALEDDFKLQFYDPAFVRIRDAARSQQVTLGQVERTTVLTNNRAFAKVEPRATMEFDLPKRQIAIKEAFDATRALIEDSGALMNDPTFLAAFQMMGGAGQPGTVRKLLPGQSTSTDQHNMGLVDNPTSEGTPGSALQSLVPDPAVFKLETGTGFQIRPVVQPDGDSVVYDFDYMYTTNIREPVRADEKHIGRVERHFVRTEVQTSNFEIREISRYLVALKVSRTARGVPLLEDIPIVGMAFRPAPSAESSLQQNVILGQTNVYPTLFDLMGLRWAPHVVDLSHASLLESEHIVRGRQKSIRDRVFGVASERVDNFLDIPTQSPDVYRPDFYHEQILPSPYHPSGAQYPYAPKDPTGRNYEILDRRPAEFQEPPYDRFRHVPVMPEDILGRMVPESIPTNRSFENTSTLELRRQGPPINSVNGNEGIDFVE